MRSVFRDLRSPSDSVSRSAAIAASIIVFASLTACTTGRVNIAASKAAQMPQFSRMYVIANIRNEYFTDGIYEGFKSTLTTSLEKCGLAVTFLNEADTSGRSREQVFKDSFASFKPDGLLTIVGAGGNVVRHTQSGGGISSTTGFDNDLLYKVSVTDVRSNKKVWDANVKFTFYRSMYTSQGGEGGRFATSVLRQLDVDEVTKCGAPPK